MDQIDFFLFYMQIRKNFEPFSKLQAYEWTCCRSGGGNKWDDKLMRSELQLSSSESWIVSNSWELHAHFSDNIEVFLTWMVYNKM